MTGNDDNKIPRRKTLRETFDAVVAYLAAQYAKDKSSIHAALVFGVFLIWLRWPVAEKEAQRLGHAEGCISSAEILRKFEAIESECSGFAISDDGRSIKSKATTNLLWYDDQARCRRTAQFSTVAEAIQKSPEVKASLDRNDKAADLISVCNYYSDSLNDLAESKGIAAPIIMRSLMPQRRQR